MLNYKFTKKPGWKGLDGAGQLALASAYGKKYVTFYDGGKKEIGYAILNRRGEFDILLTGLAIKPEYRNNGFGKECVRLLREYASEQKMPLRVSSFPNTAEFFIKCGAKTIDRCDGEVFLEF